MSYKYDPYTDTFTHVDDEEPISAYGTGTFKDHSALLFPPCNTICIDDAVIDRIADAVEGYKLF